jgi:hypothetical protein
MEIYLSEIRYIEYRQKIRALLLCAKYQTLYISKFMIV